MIDVPLRPRARRALWLTLWAALAIGGGATALLAGVAAAAAGVDAALSGQADATATPVVAMSIGLLVLVAAAAALGWLVMRGADPVDPDPADPVPGASARRRAWLPSGGLTRRQQPLWASWVRPGDDSGAD